MKHKNKGNFRAALIITVGALAFILVVLIIYKKKSTNPPVVNSTLELPKVQKNNDIIPLSEEKKAQLQAIRNITGKISSTNADTVNVIIDNGEKITLKIPNQGANFIKETIQADGSFLDEKIDLIAVPKNKQVDIQYNNSTKEVMLIVVKY